MAHFDISSNYECPCGFKFEQNEGPQFRKYKMIVRLHSKRCKIAKEDKRTSTPELAKETVDGISGAKKLKKYSLEGFYGGKNYSAEFKRVKKVE